MSEYRHLFQPTEAEMQTLRELLVLQSTILSGTNLPPTAIMLKDDVMPGLGKFRSLPIVRGPVNALVYEPVRRETCSDDTCLEKHS